MSAVLDVEDIIPTAYVLEVSSPGLDRPLRAQGDYARFAGRLAKVVMRQAVDGQLHVAVVRSPYPRARLVNVNIEAAKAANGVVDVLVGSDVEGLGKVDVAPFVPNVKQVHHPLLVSDEARYTGEATTPEEAVAFARRLRGNP